MPTAAPVLIRASAVDGAAVNATPAASAVAKAKPLPIVVLAIRSSVEEPHHSSAAAKPARASMEKTDPAAAQFPPRPRRELRRGASRPLLALQNPLVQVVHDQSRQPLVMHKQALADRVGILPGHRDRFFQDLLGADAALDIALDEPHPIFDDLRLLLKIGLAAGLAVAGHDRLGIQR